MQLQRIRVHHHNQSLSYIQTPLLIYSSLNKEQQKTVSKAFYSLQKALKMRWLISSAYHEGINGVYLLTKYGPKI